MAFDRKKYMTKYADNYNKLYINFRKDSAEDMKLYEWLKLQANKAAYIKQLIAKDMKRQKRKE